MKHDLPPHCWEASYQARDGWNRRPVALAGLRKSRWGIAFIAVYVPAVLAVVGWLCWPMWRFW